MELVLGSMSAVKLSTLEPKDWSLRSYYNHPKTSTEPSDLQSELRLVGFSYVRLQCDSGI